MQRRAKNAALLFNKGVMKIGFDWDSCLAEERQQKLAKKFLEKGHDVWIVTSRREPSPAHRQWDNKPLYAVAKQLGIPDEKIVFTQSNDKWKYLDGFDMHFDDDQIEIELIEENLPDCACVLIIDP